MKSLFEIVESHDVTPSCPTVISNDLAYNPSAPSPLWSPTQVPPEDAYFNIDSPILVSPGVSWPDAQD